MRILRALGTVLLAALFAALPLSAASAADTGLLRLAHLSPDTPPVDVYVDSVSSPGTGQSFGGVSYGTVSAYQEVPPGTYAVSMRSAGADPNSPPVLSTTVEVAAGQARTVAGVGPFADLGLAVLDDDLTPPEAGTARMRVVAAAAAAPELDVALPGGATLASGLAFSDTSSYVDVPAGSTSLQVTPSGGSPTALPVDVAAGAVYTVLVLDRTGGGLTVQATLDAAGTGSAPAGGVEAGAGGAAVDDPGHSWLPTALLGGAGVLVVAGLLTRYAPGRRAVAGRHTR